MESFVCKFPWGEYLAVSGRHTWKIEGDPSDELDKGGNKLKMMLKAE